MESTNQTIDADFENLATGCIIGAFAADALGSYNEFEDFVQTDAFMEGCMKVPGGGPFSL